MYETEVQEFIIRAKDRIALTSSNIVKANGNTKKLKDITELLDFVEVLEEPNVIYNSDTLKTVHYLTYKYNLHNIYTEIEISYPEGPQDNLLWNDEEIWDDDGLWTE